MQNSRLKNSIILRGMASNIVDEAIVILKPNIKLKKMEHSKNKGVKSDNKSKDFIVKEAENVILDYIYKINEKDALRIKKQLEKKLKIFRIISIVLFISLIISLWTK